MAEALFSRVLEMSWAGGIAVLFVLALRLCLKKAPKVYAYALWAVVLVRLLCPVEIALPVSLVPRPEAGVAGIRQEFQPQEIPVTEPSVRETNEPAAPAQEAPQPWRSPVRNGRTLAVWLWGMGVLVMMGYAAYALWRLRRQLREAVPLQEDVCLCDGIPDPFVLGLVRPKIYLPSSLSEGERCYIVAHEDCHLRRLDHWTRALGYLALCLHWFNPLVWVAYILSGRDMEMSCDEAVVKELGPEIRGDYAASLLRFATGRHLSATPLAFGEGDPKGRIRNLRQWKTPKFWVRLGAGVLCALAAVCLITTRSWPYLRRTDNSPIGPGQPVTYDLRLGTSMAGTLVAEFWDGGQLVTSSAPMAFAGNTDELSLYLRLPQSETRDQQAILTMVARDRHEKDPELVEASLETVFPFQRGSDTAFCAFSFREKRETFSTAPGKSHILAVYGFGDENGSVPAYFDDVALLEARPDLMEAMGKAILVRVNFPEKAQTPYLYQLHNDRRGLTHMVDYASQGSQAVRGSLVAEYWKAGVLAESVATPFEGRAVFSLEFSQQSPSVMEAHLAQPGPDGAWETFGIFSLENVKRGFGYSFESRDPREKLPAEPGRSYILGAWLIGNGEDGILLYDVSDMEKDPEVLKQIEQAILIRASFPEPTQEALTLDRVVELAQKGEDLTWADFEGYNYEEVGFGMYIRAYEMESPFYLMVGGSRTEGRPMYVRLCTDPDNWIDLRTEDPESFIQAVREMEAMAEILLAQERIIETP